MHDLPRLQLAGCVVAAVLVLALGARELGVSASSVTRPEPAARGRDTGIRVRPAGGGVAVVDVTGAVRRPGVYRLRAGRRVQDAVRAAGGPSKRAELSGLNLAAKLTDGAQILVPERPAAGVAVGGSHPATASPAAAPVNLNTATAEQLDTLDGIGPATARKILEYRQAHGGFGSLSDLDRIPGIGPKRLAALRGKVTV